MNPVKKFRSLDPMTKTHIKTVAVQITVLGGLVAANVILSKKNANDTNEDN